MSPQSLRIFFMANPRKLFLQLSEFWMSHLCTNKPLKNYKEKLTFLLTSIFSLVRIHSAHTIILFLTNSIPLFPGSPGWISLYSAWQRVALLEVLWMEKGLHCAQVSHLPIYKQGSSTYYTNTILYIVHRYLIYEKKISFTSVPYAICWFFLNILFFKFSVSPRCLILAICVRR